MRPLATLRSLGRDEGGAVALAVALMLPVLIGIGAFGVDVSHSRLVKNRLQSAADAGALAAVQTLQDQATARSRAIQFAGLNAPPGFGAITGAGDVEFGSFDPADRSFTPSTVDVNAIRVRAVREAARDNAAPRFLSAIWGDEGITISASAVAARTITSVYEAPELSNLDNKAGDYNEVYAYCFDFAGSGAAESRRSQMTKIAHNISSTVSYVWPTCAEGQSLSFRLRNFINSRNDAAKGKPIKGAQNNYYSDTVVENGREIFSTKVRPILETIRCDTYDECTPWKNQPDGIRHTPVAEDRPCVPGKFMYYGWEDRPTGDGDFNDIRFVMKCPTGRDVAYGASRLVR